MRYWTTQTLRIVITLSHLRALHDAIRETFLKVTNIKQLSLVLKKKLWVGKKIGSGGGGGGKIVIQSTSTSTRILATKQAKKNDITNQHSKQGKLRKVTKCLLTRFS